MRTAKEWEKTLSEDLEQQVEVDDELLDLLNKVSGMKEAGGGARVAEFDISEVTEQLKLERIEEQTLNDTLEVLKEQARRLGYIAEVKLSPQP